MSKNDGGAVKERPILFNGSMVKAILIGMKTESRRVIKPQPDGWPVFHDGEWWQAKNAYIHQDVRIRCPYGIPGNRLWVRETHGLCKFPGTETSFGHTKVLYRADGETSYDIGKWRPSIHMQRWASRITLEVISIKVRRIQSILPSETVKEGMATEQHISEETRIRFAYDRFPELWNSINAKRGFGWDVNPWVWVIEFRKVDQNNT